MAVGWYFQAWSGPVTFRFSWQLSMNVCKMCSFYTLFLPCSLLSTFGVTPSHVTPPPPCRHLQLCSSKQMLHFNFRANEASSYSQLISISHHQSLEASADEMWYNYGFFRATIQPLLPLDHFCPHLTQPSLILWGRPLLMLPRLIPCPGACVQVRPHGTCRLLVYNVLIFNYI